MSCEAISEAHSDETGTVTSASALSLTSSSAKQSLIKRSRLPSNRGLLNHQKVDVCLHFLSLLERMREPPANVEEQYRSQKNTR